ncbi:MAG: hypothetical protein WBW49_16545, partial [Candidatus Acidiferrum sp.]
VELDNEFERRMSEAGYPGAGISLSLWYTVMRFVGDQGLRVQELAERSSAALAPIKFELGCLERWRFVTLQPDVADQRPIPRTLHKRAGRKLRAGWGSARGIRDEWIVRATPKGQKGIEVWTPLVGEIEQRWENRFGPEVMGGLRKALSVVAEQLDRERREKLSNSSRTNEKTTSRKRRSAAELNFPALLTRLLMAFAREFRRESKVPLELCANTLRVLGEKPIAEREIPRLTGTSPETSGISWQVKPFVVIEPDPSARRGKVVRLNALGLATQAGYWRLVGEIEKRWGERFGEENVREVRERLLGIFALRDKDGLLLAQGLRPPEGVTRAGHQAPALGRRDVGSAARQRMRDLVAQTGEFMRDPTNALPHYPLWDMNRGFGP